MGGHVSGTRKYIFRNWIFCQWLLQACNRWGPWPGANPGVQCHHHGHWQKQATLLLQQEVTSTIMHQFSTGPPTWSTWQRTVTTPHPHTSTAQVCASDRSLKYCLLFRVPQFNFSVFLSLLLILRLEWVTHCFRLCSCISDSFIKHCKTIRLYTLWKMLF